MKMKTSVGFIFALVLCIGAGNVSGAEESARSLLDKELNLTSSWLTGMGFEPVVNICSTLYASGELPKIEGAQMSVKRCIEIVVLENKPHELNYEDGVRWFAREFGTGNTLRAKVPFIPIEEVERRAIAKEKAETKKVQAELQEKTEEVAHLKGIILEKADERIQLQKDLSFAREESTRAGKEVVTLKESLKVANGKVKVAMEEVLRVKAEPARRIKALKVEDISVGTGNLAVPDRQELLYPALAITLVFLFWLWKGYYDGGSPMGMELKVAKKELESAQTKIATLERELVGKKGKIEQLETEAAKVANAIRENTRSWQEMKIELNTARGELEKRKLGREEVISLAEPNTSEGFTLTSIFLENGKEIIEWTAKCGAKVRDEYRNRHVNHHAHGGKVVEILA